MSAKKSSTPGALARIGLLLEGLAYVFVYGAALDLVARLLGTAPPYTAGESLGSSFLVFVIVVAATFGGLRARGENYHDLGLSRERYAPALAIVLGLVGGICVAALGFAAEVGLALLGQPEPLRDYAASGWSTFGVHLLGGFLLFGVAHELVFRGAAFRRLERAFAKKGEPRRGLLWSALLLSALVGFAHAGEGWTGQLVAALTSLGLFGVFLAAKRDLGVVIVAHTTLFAVHLFLATR